MKILWSLAEKRRQFKADSGGMISIFIGKSDFFRYR